MHNIQFFIFGTPNGFDIYQETYNAEISNYYLCFYDETIKEHTRLAIHRKSNGEVSYTFLKYHLSSCKGRAGAFLGLSVVFKNEYYADVSSLYNLLEYAYKSITQKGILLTTDGIKFIPDTFSKVKEEILRVQSLVVGNLASPQYADGYKTFDATFVSGKENALLKIPFQVYDDATKEKALNLFVEEKLKNFSWLSLSPDYIKEKPKKTPSTGGGGTPSIDELEEVLDPATKLRYAVELKPYTNQLLNAFEDYLNKRDKNLAENVKQLDENIKKNLWALKVYGQKQDELKDLLDNYSELSKKVDTLTNQLYEMSQDSTTITGNNNNGNNSDRDSGGNPQPNPDRKPIWPRYLITFSGVLVAACLFIFFFGPHLFSGTIKPNIDDNESDKRDTTIVSENTEEKLSEELGRLVANFHERLQKDDYTTATANYKEICKKCQNSSYKDSIQRSLYKKINAKFKSLIDAHKFKEADEMINDCLSSIYESVKDYKDDLTDAIKSYVDENKNKRSMKENLITIINWAQSKGYKYVGIDTDLEFIKALTAPSTRETKYTLNIKEENEQYHSKLSTNDTIKIHCGILYTIKVENWENGAKFSYDNPIPGIEIYPQEKGKNAIVTVKATDKNKIGTSLQIHYKQESKKLFTINLIVVKNTSQTGRFRKG
ncbi:MAG: hypothetical protein IJY36_07430 [Coprobacter sp.]|nr:hypothetical protein [Coprobacter sp.]